MAPQRQTYAHGLPTKRKALPTNAVHVQRVYLAAAAFGTAIAVVYGPVLPKLATDWWNDPDYSHGLLCAPLAIAMIVARRRKLSAIPAAPRAAGLAGVVIALGLLLLGTLGAELFLTRISLLLLLASSVVFLFGWRHLRVLAFPFVLLLLSIPIPAILITRITLPLQFMASAMSEAVLGLTSVPVLREGNVLVLPNATLQVAEACSGIRSLASLFVLALLVARFAERRVWARAAVVASAVPIAVVVNGLRVTITAIATYWYGTVAVDGVLHEGTGFIMFAIAVALLIVCARGVGNVGVGRSAEQVA